MVVGVEKARAVKGMEAAVARGAAVEVAKAPVTAMAVRAASRAAVEEGQGAEVVAVMAVVATAAVLAAVWVATAVMAMAAVLAAVMPSR